MFVTHFAHNAVVVRQLAVRAGADAQIVSELPVVEVMPALLPMAGKTKTTEAKTKKPIRII